MVSPETQQFLSELPRKVLSVPVWHVGKQPRPTRGWLAVYHHSATHQVIVTARWGEATIKRFPDITVKSADNARLQWQLLVGAIILRLHHESDGQALLAH